MFSTIDEHSEIEQDDQTQSDIEETSIESDELDSSKKEVILSHQFFFKHMRIIQMRMTGVTLVPQTQDKHIP